MTHIITGLCLRDGACVEVCPVECIVPGMPAEEWPWFYIDPETCIDCGACVPECPFEAIFPEEDVPEAHELADDAEYVFHKGGKRITGPETLDLTLDSKPNYDFFNEDTGVGYWDGWEDYVADPDRPKGKQLS
jgi:ferredoxin